MSYKSFIFPLPLHRRLALSSVPSARGLLHCANGLLLNDSSTALRGDTENTPLQLKLNDLAELIAKVGSAAGILLFTALMIRFFVQLGTNEPPRTANQKGIAFVQILIISVTLIVVAVPEGADLVRRTK